TRQNGVRFTLDSETRDSQMPAFGADGILTPEQKSDVANFVVKLSGGEADAAAATRGAQVFAENCVACHGDGGQGNREMGGPNLSDQISLYGSDLAAIMAQVQRPRHGVMPAWGGRLDQATVKQLAIYVHSLGGGEQAVPSQ
ncbi:MAG TPA: c-type cytochrome, partial [Aestuariivirga sp.]|nr:c-type cytochrome [Aestuariivirga sp.]